MVDDSRGPFNLEGRSDFDLECALPRALLPPDCRLAHGAQQCLKLLVPAVEHSQVAVLSLPRSPTLEMVDLGLLGPSPSLVDERDQVGESGLG